MGLDNLVGYGQSQARTCPFGAALVYLIKALKYTRQVLLGNAITGVLDLYHHSTPVVQSGTQPHLSTIRCVFDGIIDQIEQDLTQACRITQRSISGMRL